MARFETVEEYLASFPEEEQTVLRQVREIALAAVPGGEDAIRYDMPTVVADGRSVVHYAGWRHHVSIYPLPDTDDDPGLAAELAPLVAGKGTLKLPLSRPLPTDLVRRVVEALARRG